MRKAIMLAVALTTLALPALAQQQPASLPQTKAETDLNAAWQQMVAAAETAAISGPDQLRAAKAARGALQVWMAEQRQKLADQQAKLEQAQRERLSMSQQVAALNKRLVDVDKQLADAKKPTSDQKTIAQLNTRIVELQHEADSEYQESAEEVGSLNRQLADMQRQCSKWGWVDQSGHSTPPHSTPAPGRK